MPGIDPRELVPVSPCVWCQVAEFVAEEVAQYIPGLKEFLQIFQPQTWLNFFIGLFSGRPKLGPDSATDNAALSLLAAANPVFRNYGGGLRVLESQGVAISTTAGPGRTKLNALTALLSQDLAFQYGALGQSQFNSAIAYVFSHNCTDAPCASVFRNDPTFRSWVSQGLLRASDGYPLWRSAAQPAPSPTPAPAPAPTCGTLCQQFKTIWAQVSASPNYPWKVGRQQFSLCMLNNATQAAVEACWTSTILQLRAQGHTVLVGLLSQLLALHQQMSITDRATIRVLVSQAGGQPIPVPAPLPIPITPQPGTPPGLPPPQPAPTPTTCPPGSTLAAGACGDVRECPTCLPNVPPPTPSPFSCPPGFVVVAGKCGDVRECPVCVPIPIPIPVPIPPPKSTCACAGGSR